MTREKIRKKGSEGSEGSAGRLWEALLSHRRRGDREGTRREQREQEDDERREKERGLRSDELRESWRRNHPSGEEDTDMDRRRRGSEDAGGAA
jgi:hypothetical protein